uniref:Uncharacterized protein n=1 Tax=Eutreptiella gymnastica TaxID=73025 RepID=A0A7S4FR57_9EUGL
MAAGLRACLRTVKDIRTYGWQAHGSTGRSTGTVAQQNPGQFAHELAGEQWQEVSGAATSSSACQPVDATSAVPCQQNDFLTAPEEEGQKPIYERTRKLTLKTATVANP